MPEPTAEPASALVDIVETAVAAGSFNTLAQALTAANLVETLKGEGPFTVFAPTDEAFAALPEGALDALLANPEELTRVLTYHVVSGSVDAATVTGLSEAATVAGPNVAIEVVDGMVKINDATVTTADVMASNGIIHVIDTVLMPPAAN
ncbi:MAG: fasciclin domain-containing protein [Candidatus Sericytochromatia bacterium]|nr:fasciclin domain-containing protein [Candidatus Sericytochromatia bacterium]